MKRAVRIYGALGKKYGRRFDLEVASTTEAVRLLAVQIPGLKDDICKGVYRVTIGKSPREGIFLDETTLNLRVPVGDIHIVPVVRGGKSQGIGKLIVGTLLVAASFFVPVGGSILASIGLSMALTGVSSLLSANKKKEKQKKSYMDSGQQTGGQGGCVPLVVGRFMVTPMIISAGVSVADSNGLV